MDGEGSAYSRAVRTALLSVFIALFSLTVVLIAFSFPAGLYSVFVGRLSDTFSYTSLARPYLWIGPVIAFLPFQLSTGAFFVFLTGVYVAMFAYLLWEKSGPLSALGSSFRDGFQALFSSPLIVTVVAIGFLTFTASIIDDAVSSAGVPVGSVSGDALALFLGFTTSPLIEEFGFRMLLVGVVAVILCIGRPPKTALKALWRPSVAVEGLAVGSGASIIIWAAMGFSAVTFGACHVLCGTTWDIGKFPEAAYGGFVLAFLYVKYGFHVAVLAHWGVDYFGSVFSFFGQAAYGIPWNSGTTEFIGQYLVDWDMLILFGFACFLVVLYIGLKKLVRPKTELSSAGLSLEKGAAQGESAEQ